jgi:calcineurin-like phosphoesterase family protein
MIYIISDTHFGHKNIMKYCNRPFDSVDYMDRVIASNWNRAVSPEDEIFHLGDVGCWYGTQEWLSILPKLNGKKYLVPGNHDKKLLNPLRKVFELLPPIHEFRYSNEEGEFGFVLSHYPIFSWNGKFHGSIHCYGHSHSKVKELGPQAFDASVDSNNFYPISIENVIVSVTKEVMEPGYHGR